MLLRDLIGQDQAATILRRAVAAGRVPHAYLFEGPRGVGKRAAGIGLAMLLNCEQTARPGNLVGGQDMPACGTCEPCRRVLGGLHPDVITVTATTAQIVMEQAQEIVSMVQTRPHEGRARVVLIDDADRLNASAGNCLLKTLEEPASRSHLILVSAAPERLLPTIRSRTQRVRFRSVSQADLMALAARKGLDSTRAQVASVMADGRVGRFLALTAPDQAARDPETLDADGDSDRPASADETRAIVAQLRAAAISRGTIAAFDAAAALGDKESKVHLPEALAVLARVYRDAIAVRAGAPDLALFTPGTTTDIDLPLGSSIATLTRALDVIVEAEAALVGNVNAVMTLERLLIQLHRLERETPRAA